jgi:hypothetical protein
VSKQLPDWAENDQEQAVFWLDDNHAVTWTYIDGQVNGGLFWHRVPERNDSATPGWCVGGFRIPHEKNPVNAPTWTLESRDPMTLSPSLLCGCGHHGFIRDGKWVPA